MYKLQISAKISNRVSEAKPFLNAFFTIFWQFTLTKHVFKTDNNRQKMDGIDTLKRSETFRFSFEESPRQSLACMHCMHSPHITAFSFFADIFSKLC